MATKYRDSYIDNKTLWQLAMVPFVSVISEGPGAGYVRGRAPELQRAGEPLPSAVFCAMAEYVGTHPVNPTRERFAPCPVCGRPAKVYAGRHGWPDMAHCPRCGRTYVVREGAQDAPAQAATAEKLEWWQQ